MTSRLLLDDDDLANSTSRYTLPVIFGMFTAGSMITTSPPSSATAMKGRVRAADVIDWMTNSRRRKEDDELMVALAGKCID